MTDLFVTDITNQLDLSHSAQRATLARQIKRDIDIYCEKAYDGGHRKHLGASQIGHPCKRALWYVFRWVKRETYITERGTDNKGRMMRLFNRGHREEDRFVEWLRGIGAQVWDHNPEKPTDQFRISNVNGHFGGSLDGIAQLPAKYGVNFPILAEFKTQGTGPKFEALVKDGVQKEKEMHFAQMSTYGFHYQLSYAIYQAINKNDDDLHVEIVKLDWKLGAEMIVKAREIIEAPPHEPPPKFSLSPANLICRV
jgi:hypothetical protein